MVPSSILVEFGGVCGYNTKDGKSKTEIVPLLSCNKDITGNHKFTDKLNESS